MEDNGETLFLDKNGNCKHIVCEICGTEELVQFEGAEPNTCAMCLPLEPDEEDCGYHDTRTRHFDYDD